jgi:hypothetical protein
MTTPHFETRGPFNIPMKDVQARALEEVLKTLPQPAEPKFITIAKAPSELLPGERADVSWISTEDIDRDNEIVVAKGMDDSHFKLNPIVTLQHCYDLPPVGRSLWRKRTSDGQLRGIKAKTQYPRRPQDWPAASDWPPDITFNLIQNGLLLGKSIGFLSTKTHAPTEDEVKKNPALVDCRRIIDEWLLLEYACVYIPCQQNAVVEAVSKGLKIPDQLLDLFGIPKEIVKPASESAALGASLPTSPIAFTTMHEIQNSIARQIEAIDFKSLARRAVQDGIDRARGRV